MSDYSINMKETCNKIYKKLLDENFHVDMWSDIADTMYDESAVSQLIYQIFSTNFYNSFDESKRLIIISRIINFYHDFHYYLFLDTLSIFHREYDECKFYKLFKMFDEDVKQSIFRYAKERDSFMEKFTKLKTYIAFS